jgi:ABC-2 type transport system ATP-binding protein
MVIETEKLTKYYGSKLGCRDVSISVREGEIFGLLGPNGAGKSTIIKILNGLIYPDAGSARLLGKPIGDVSSRYRTGYLPEKYKYQEWMTGRELLAYHAALCKLEKVEASKRIDEVLDMVKLKDSEKSKIGTYSNGMQQRIGIACALLSRPQLLFLDEPTSALDPVGRKEIREIILDLRDHGTSILLNSHLLSEVELVCDSIAIINKGIIVKQGQLKDILERQLNIEAVVDNISDAMITALSKIGSDIECIGNCIHMKVSKREDISEVASLIMQYDGRLYGLSHKHDSLEQLFVQLMEEGV